MRCIKIILLLFFGVGLFAQNNAIPLRHLKYAPGLGYSITSNNIGQQVYIFRDSLGVDAYLTDGWHSNDTLYLEISRVSGVNGLGAIDTVPVYLPLGGVSMNAGPGISITGSGTIPDPYVITNTEPDLTVTISDGGGIGVSGTYPNFVLSTIDQSSSNEGVLSVGAGGANTAELNSNTSGANSVIFGGLTGIGISETTSGNGGTIEIINTLPDQTVTITNGGGVAVSGSYPNFTLTAADQSDTNEFQTLFLNDDTLGITNGNNVLLGSIYTATNGLTKTGNQFLLGGALTQTTSLTGNFALNRTGVLNSASLMTITNTGTTSIGLTSTGVSTGVAAIGDTYGLTGSSILWPIGGNNTSTSTNTITTGARLYRGGSYNGAMGNGIRIDFAGRSSTNQSVVMATIGGVASDATNGAMDGTLEFSTISNNVLARKAQLMHTGQLSLDNYGVGTFTGTPAKWLAVTAGGVVIEENAPGGGGDNWGTQVVESGTTLVGTGIIGNLLDVDTSIIATQNYVTSQGYTTAQNLSQVLTVGNDATSQSIANILNIDIEGYADYGEIATPGNPAANTVRLWSETDGGFTQLHFKDANGLDHQFARDNIHTVRNNSGSTINKGQWVYISGSSGVFPTIELAKADNIATMPVAGIVLANITNNSFGQIMTHGDATGMNTSGFVDGDVIYISEVTSGLATTTKPTGTNIAQRIGVVVKSSAGAGIISVLVGGENDPTSTQTLQNKTINSLNNTITITESNISDLQAYALAARNINTSGSLTGGGNLTADRTLTLVNDNATPGNSKYYGTDIGGTKGFYDLPAGGSGEANTASNLGSGDTIFYQKTGVDLEFKSLVALDGIEFTTSTTEIGIKRQNVLTPFDTTATSYTLALVDMDRRVYFSSGSDVIVTIPLFATVAFPVGTILTFSRYGAGELDVAVTGGVTLNSAGGFRSCNSRYQVMELHHKATNVWVLAGDLKL